MPTKLRATFHFILGGDFTIRRSESCHGNNFLFPLREANCQLTQLGIRASFDPERSGDLLVALKPHITAIGDPKSYVATHGSPWNYDRRVPLLFYRPNTQGFEQPLPVETVDILPTLAALVRLPIPRAQIDGRCIDLDPSADDTCVAMHR